MSNQQSESTRAQPVHETMHVDGGVPVKSWTRGVPF